MMTLIMTTILIVMLELNDGYDDDTDGSDDDDHDEYRDDDHDHDDGLDELF